MPENEVCHLYFILMSLCLSNIVESISIVYISLMSKLPILPIPTGNFNQIRCNKETQTHKIKLRAFCFIIRYEKTILPKFDQCQ